MVCYISLGTNLGDLEKNLNEALEKISNIENLTVLKKSKFHRTKAWGVTEQPDFLNAVVMLDTDILPQDLLIILQDIEKNMGKIVIQKWGPRIIDIDILFCDDMIIETETLVIPHPYLHLRGFVLKPMVEIAPDFVHPVFKKKISDYAVPTASRRRKV